LTCTVMQSQACSLPAMVQLSLPTSLCWPLDCPAFTMAIQSLSSNLFPTPLQHKPGSQPATTCPLVSPPFRVALRAGLCREGLGHGLAGLPLDDGMADFALELRSRVSLLHHTVRCCCRHWIVWTAACSRSCCASRLLAWLGVACCCNPRHARSQNRKFEWVDPITGRLTWLTQQNRCALAVDGANSKAAYTSGSS
jgi:hypothetical protein